MDAKHMWTTSVKLAKILVLISTFYSCTYNSKMFIDFILCIDCLNGTSPGETKQLLLPAWSHTNDPAGSSWTFLTNHSLHLWSLSLAVQGKAKKSSLKHELGNKKIINLCDTEKQRLKISLMTYYKFSSLHFHLLSSFPTNSPPNNLTYSLLSLLSPLLYRYQHLFLPCQSYLMCIWIETKQLLSACFLLCSLLLLSQTWKACESKSFSTFCIYIHWSTKDATWGYTPSPLSALRSL